MLAHLSPNGESVTERPNDERHALLRRLVHPSDTTLVAETRTVETAEELMTVFDAAIGARLEGIVAMAPLDELRRWDGAGLPPAPPGGLRREVLQGVARVMTTRVVLAPTVAMRPSRSPFMLSSPAQSMTIFSPVKSWASDT